MTFIKYTNDGKAVIQPAALTLSGLDGRKKLEMHTLNKAIVLLKDRMTAEDKLAAINELLRLANSLAVSVATDMKKEQEFQFPYYAMTATEAALYDQVVNGNLRYWMGSLTHKNLPLAIFLEEADLGYPAWSGSTNSKASNDQIMQAIKFGVRR